MSEAMSLKATASHRGTTEKNADIPGIMQDIGESSELRAMWEKYRKQFVYAKDIAYEVIMSVIRDLVL